MGDYFLWFVYCSFFFFCSVICKKAINKFRKTCKKDKYHVDQMINSEIAHNLLNVLENSNFNFFKGLSLNIFTKDKRFMELILLVLRIDFSCKWAHHIVENHFDVFWFWFLWVKVYISFIWLSFLIINLSFIFWSILFGVIFFLELFQVDLKQLSDNCQLILLLTHFILVGFQFCLNWNHFIGLFQLIW